jgi:hypothetical protein
MSVLLIAETTTHHHRIVKNEKAVVVTSVSPTALERESVRESAAERGTALDWLRERAIPVEDGTATTLEALHADYEVWCMGYGL